jgi:hypothetical protein
MFQQIFVKPSSIKFHENPSSGTELFHKDGRTGRQTEGQTDRETDMTKPMVAFRSFAKASKTYQYSSSGQKFEIHTSLMREIM